MQLDVRNRNTPHYAPNRNALLSPPAKSMRSCRSALWAPVRLGLSLETAAEGGAGPLLLWNGMGHLGVGALGALHTQGATRNTR